MLQMVNDLIRELAGGRGVDALAALAGAGGVAALPVQCGGGGGVGRCAWEQAAASQQSDAVAPGFERTTAAAHPPQQQLRSSYTRARQPSPEHGAHVPLWLVTCTMNDLMLRWKSVPS